MLLLSTEKQFSNSIINGTKNNAKELDQRIRIDQASMMLLGSFRRLCIAEDGDGAGGWRVAGQYFSV